MWWRANIILWSILSVGISSGIITVLVILMLIPSLTKGPDNVQTLVRTNCLVDNITFIDNWCLRDTTQDFSNLVYRDDWLKCILVRLNISTSTDNLTCSWFYPQYFVDQVEAYIVTSPDYIIGTKYNCVIDTINNICYPDKNEVFTFILSISCLTAITILIFSIYCYLKMRWKRKSN